MAPVVEAMISGSDNGDDEEDEQFATSSVEENDLEISVYSPKKKKEEVNSIVAVKKFEWRLLEMNASEQFVKAIKLEYPHAKTGGYSKPPYNARKAVADDDVISRYVRYKFHDRSSDEKERHDDDHSIGTEILILKLRNGSTTISSRPLAKIAVSSKSSHNIDDCCPTKIDHRFVDKLDELCKGTSFAAHL